jgi:hypothetical protein
VVWIIDCAMRTWMVHQNDTSSGRMTSQLSSEGALTAPSILTALSIPVTTILRWLTGAGWIKTLLHHLADGRDSTTSGTARNKPRP